MVNIKTLFQNIADAIKTKGGTTTTLTPGEMPQAILDLPRGGKNYKYRYIKFVIYDYPRYGVSGNDVLQLSNLYFSDGTNQYIFNGASILSTENVSSVGGSESVNHIIGNSNGSNKWVDLINSTYPFPKTVVIDLGEQLDFSIYKYVGFYNGNDTEVYRTRCPLNWSLYGSNDNTEYVLLKNIGFISYHNLSVAFNSGVE